MQVIRDLEDLLESSLYFREHIDCTVNKANRTLCFIKRMSKPFRNNCSLIIPYLILKCKDIVSESALYKVIESEMSFWLT